MIQNSCECTIYMYSLMVKYPPTLPPLFTLLNKLVLVCKIYTGNDVCILHDDHKFQNTIFKFKLHLCKKKKNTMVRKPKINLPIANVNEPTLRFQRNIVVQFYNQIYLGKT